MNSLPSLLLCIPPPQTLVLTVGRVGQLESQRATSHLVFLSLVPPPERPAPVSRGPSPPSPVIQLTGSSVSSSRRSAAGHKIFLNGFSREDQRLTGQQRVTHHKSSQ
ncbi:hypothetical protein ABG768_009630 [Culter alburnus]|uniref:Uncharacterized protein n=1 Tax=Culter alburnus TaxID=194366 RepID=A0AAW1ZDG1_CULAL